MSFFPLKKLPRYECLLEAAEEFPDLDPSACEAFLHLLRTGDDAFQISAAQFAKHRISSGGFMVLMLLQSGCAERGVSGSTPAELAGHAGVARATMTGLIDTLEREGLVRRQPDAADRRRRSVQPTARARRLLQSILPGHFQRMAAFMRPLTVSERKTLVRLLKKILEEEASPSSRVAAR